MIIADKAVIAWARRHGRLCKIVAENFETDPKRKEELMMIADICHRVPAEPSKGLRDAMQAKWFTYLICHSIENYASGYAHKEDKVLWPYYKMSVMKAPEKAAAAGLVQPTAETCKGCHNEESPTFKGFDYDEYWAKIAHPKP